MERLAELIGKLNEQFEQKADSSKLLATTLLIERELMKEETTRTVQGVSSKVAVMMPATHNGHLQARNGTVQEDAAPAPVDEISQAAARSEEEEKKELIQEFNFNPLTEIPTLSQQHTIKEINEMLGITDASLNDKLKENRTEIGHLLTGHPIKDLKKAIGINDRYVFINELFRGDEIMYERSIKTINSFSIYPEAEYWIERELKVKLGWEEHRETTRQFYQLVRRRFS